MSFEMMFTIFKFVLAPIMYGWVINGCIFLFLYSLGFNFDKKAKLKCFIPVTLLVLVFITLVRISLC